MSAADRDHRRPGRPGFVTLRGSIQEFLVPDTYASPWGIAAGPDGNLWFTELGQFCGLGHKIGRITPAGVVHEFSFKVKDLDGRNDAHTVTVANAADIPNTVPKVFNCGSDPNHPCGQTFQCLFGGGTPTYKCDPDSVPGLDQPGDVILLTATHPTTTRITAPPGTVLHYFCAFHAWMQGTIRVV